MGLFTSPWRLSTLVHCEVIETKSEEGLGLEAICSKFMKRALEEQIAFYLINLNCNYLVFGILTEAAEELLKDRKMSRCK